MPAELVEQMDHNLMTVIGQSFHLYRLQSKRLNVLQYDSVLLLKIVNFAPLSQSDGSAAYISISNSTGQNFTLWKGLHTILYFQEVLVMLLNLHV